MINPLILQPSQDLPVKLSMTLPQSGTNATKENIPKVAQSAENNGIDSRRAFENLLWPIKSLMPYPGMQDGHLPEEYPIMYVQPITFGFAAAKTSCINIGRYILNALFCYQVILAKAIEILNNLSDGRLIAGFGLRWMKDEFQSSNISFKKKSDRDHLALVIIIKRIWTKYVVGFEGGYYLIPNSIIGSKLKRTPIILFYLGGFSSNSLFRIVQFNANGWLGIVLEPVNPLEKIIQTIKSGSSKANKELKSFGGILLSYPQVYEEKATANHFGNKSHRLPIQESKSKIGSDFRKLKFIGLDNFILSFIFSKISKDLEKCLEITLQLPESANNY